MRGRLATGVVVVLGLVLAGCGEPVPPEADPLGETTGPIPTGGEGREPVPHAPDPPGDPTSPTPTGREGGETMPPVEEQEAPPVDEAPPPVTIRWGGQSHDLTAWASCGWTTPTAQSGWSSCAGGTPPDEPFDVGSPDQVVVEFPQDDWEFSASFKEVGAECPRYQPELETRDDGTHLLTPAVDPATYDVTLFGGDEDGRDLFVTFRWTVGADGPVAPEAWVGVLTDHDGRLDSYGVEVGVRHLATTSSDASATVTVLDGDGDELTTVELDQDDSMFDQGDACMYAVIGWMRDVAATGRSSDEWQQIPLDDGPFTYGVELVLDGTVHRATATWPDDVLPEFVPVVPLEFTPPLPSRGSASRD